MQNVFNLTLTFSGHTHAITNVYAGSPMCLQFARTQKPALAFLRFDHGAGSNGVFFIFMRYEIVVPKIHFRLTFSATTPVIRAISGLIYPC